MALFHDSSQLISCGWMHDRDLSLVFSGWYMALKPCFFWGVLQLPLLHDLPGLATNPLSPLDWSIRRISIGGGFRCFFVFLCRIWENIYQVFKIDQHAPDILFLVALGWILKPPTMWLVFYWGHRLSAGCPVKRAEPAGMKKHKDPWIQWANHRHITDPTPTSL